MDKLDTIDVIYNEVTHDSGTLGEYIELILNGETVKGTFDAYSFALSGDDARITTYYLLTCGCGVAGCAGIIDGTVVKRRRYTVEWRDIDCGLPKRFYSFSRIAYDAAVAKAFRLMRELAEKREARGANTKDDEYDGILGFWSVEEFEERLAWTKRWKLEGW